MADSPEPRSQKSKKLGKGSRGEKLSPSKSRGASKSKSERKSEKKSEKKSPDSSERRTDLETTTKQSKSRTNLEEATPASKSKSHREREKHKSKSKEKRAADPAPETEPKKSNSTPQLPSKSKSESKGKSDSKSKSKSERKGDSSARAASRRIHRSTTAAPAPRRDGEAAVRRVESRNKDTNLSWSSRPAIRASSTEGEQVSLSSSKSARKSDRKSDNVRVREAKSKESQVDEKNSEKKNDKKSEDSKSREKKSEDSKRDKVRDGSKGPKESRSQRGKASRVTSTDSDAPGVRAHSFLAHDADAPATPTKPALPAHSQSAITLRGATRLTPTRASPRPDAAPRRLRRHRTAADSVMSPRHSTPPRRVAPTASLSPGGLLRSLPDDADGVHSDVPRSFMSDEGTALQVGEGIITFERDGTKMIYGGRVEKIIETLLTWITTESNRSAVFKLVNMFISCYRKFHRPVEILDLLISFWYSPPPPGADEEKHLSIIRSSVIMFLGEWFVTQVSDLVSSDATTRLEEFLKNLPDNYREAILAKLRQVTNRAPRPSIILFEPSRPGKLLEPGKFGLFDVKPQQIADQWTLLDMRNFQEISRNEFFHRSADGTNWDRMLRRSAMFSRWVASEVVQVPELAQRVEVIKRFVQIAMAFLETNNFNGLMSVWGGLNGTAVHRLARTKKALPKKTAEIWSALQAKLSEAHNFGGLRKAMERQASKGEPLVPWFELINKLRNWADNYNDYITQTKSAQPLLNFGKMYIIGEQMLAFDRYQRVNETVDLTLDDTNQTDAAIRFYLEHLPTYSDETLWRLSTQCEPDHSGLSDPSS